MVQKRFDYDLKFFIVVFIRILPFRGEKLRFVSQPTPGKIREFD